MGEVVGDVEVLDLEVGDTEALTSVATVERAPSRRRLPLAVAAVIALVVVGSVVVDRARSDSTTPSPATTTPVEGARAPATTTLPVPQRIGAGPLLGEPVGFVIAIGGRESAVRVVDLDRGQLRTMTAGLEPRLVADGFLVMQDNWDRWYRQPLDAPRSDPEPFRVSGLRHFPQGVRDADDGGVWLRRQGERGGANWYRVNVLTGDVLQHVYTPADAYVPEGSDGRPLSGPEVVGSDGGGIFALTTDGTYARVADGRLIAVGDDLVLASTCDAELRCSNRWLDRGDFSDAAATAPASQLGSGYLDDGGEVLVVETFGPATDVVKLFDTASGRAVGSGQPPFIEEVWVSPDGRFVARRNYGSLLVTDIGTGRATRLTGVTIEPGEELIWGSVDG